MRINNIAKAAFVINTALLIGFSTSNFIAFAEDGDYENPAVQFYNKGIDYYNAANYSAAIAQFEQALKLNPKNINVRNNMAATYINMGVDLFNKRLDITKAANYYRKAIFYLKYDENVPPVDQVKKNLDIATENLNDALKVQKISLTPRSRYNLAKELRGQGAFKEAVVEFNRALSDKNLCPDSYETLGDIMRVLQKDSNAVDYYEKAIVLKPDKAILHLKIARAFQKLDDFDNAIKGYNLALDYDQGNSEIISALENIWTQKLRENPQDAVAHMNLGVVLQKKKDFEGALAQYKASEFINPSNPTLRLNMGTLFQAQGNLDMAIKAYDSIITENPTEPQVHYYRATALRDMGNIRGAIDEFQIVLKIDPTNRMAKKAIYETVKKSNNPEEILSILEYFAKNNPNDSVAQYNYAYELHLQKKSDEALIFYQRALIINPSLVDADLNLASIYREKNQNNEAISVLHNALKIDPDNKKVKDLIAQIKESSVLENYKQAVTMQNKGNYKAAIEDYKKLIAEGGADADTYVSLGSAYQASNEFDDAIKSYTKAVELEKNNSTALYYLGTAYYSKKNYSKAKDYYSRALVLDPENKDIKNAISDIKIAISDNVLDKGLNELNAKRYIKAMEIFNYAIKNNPDNAYAYYYRGMLYDALKKTSLAISDYNKAVVKSKDLNVAYYSLAIDYDLLKNKIEAKKAYEKFISDSSNADAQYVKYAKQRLKSLN